MVNSIVNVSASGSSSAANGDLTFNIASGTYTYTINSFGAGDKLKLFSGAITSVVPDTNDTDGIQSIAFTNPVTTAIATITLTSLANAQDAGGIEKRPDAKADVVWHIAMRPGKRKKLNKTNEADALLDQAEKLKASVRAKVEHLFRVIKRQFGFVKVRYRGLKKNTAQLFALFCTVQSVDGAQQIDGSRCMSAPANRADLLKGYKTAKMAVEMQ